MASEHMDRGPVQAGQARPPVDLPRAARLFWSVRPDFAELGDPATSPRAGVLERLGPPPFPKTGFPFVGFLATIYDHVAAHAGGTRPP